jgi:hypothetical protein
VTKKYTEGDAHVVDVDFNLSVEMGPHAWGTVTMVLPTKG